MFVLCNILDIIIICTLLIKWPLHIPDITMDKLIKIVQIIQFNLDNNWLNCFITSLLTIIYVTSTYILSVRNLFLKFRCISTNSSKITQTCKLFCYENVRFFTAKVWKFNTILYNTHLSIFFSLNHQSVDYELDIIFWLQLDLKKLMKKK